MPKDLNLSHWKIIENMPIVESKYNPSILFKNGFYSTVYSGLVRKIERFGEKHIRERLELSDGDFLDLDWDLTIRSSTKLLILFHGLEGSADRSYMLGSAKLFNKNGFDVLRVNLRGCSGSENLKFRSYHSGATEDLEEVVQFVIRKQKYSHIFLKGFSLGGNLVLKYLGENKSLPSELRGAVAVSVPCFLEGSAKSLLRIKNIPYAIRFKRNLLQKLRQKQRSFPDRITQSDINKIKNLIDFDDVFTSKAHGFLNAKDYYTKSSSLHLLPNINIPTLLINARNDSFLSEECYPIKEATANDNLYLEVPKYGGHVGFHLKGEFFYNEIRALEFIQEILSS